MADAEIPWGPVVVVDGPHLGRIGYYDDDTVCPPDELREYNAIKDTDVGIVYFGAPLMTSGYHYVPLEFLREITTDDLLTRREELNLQCGMLASHLNTTSEERIYGLIELHYIDTLLLNRMMSARYTNDRKGAKVFISHSSKDKGFAKWLATDLSAAGHQPWLDEWSIEVGESIPQKISEGISEADFVIVILSEASAASRWVEREWHAKYWDEVSSGRIAVLPVLFQDCSVPELLKTKKYADFRSSYNNGLEDVMRAVDRLLANKPAG